MLRRLSRVPYVPRADRARKLVIVEIGAGTEVPSVRSAGESLLGALSPKQCTLIRINPAPVTGDNSTDGVLMLKWGGEEAVEAISSLMRKQTRRAREEEEDDDMDELERLGFSFSGRAGADPKRHRP